MLYLDFYCAFCTYSLAKSAYDIRILCIIKFATRVSCDLMDTGGIS